MNKTLLLLLTIFTINASETNEVRAKVWSQVVTNETTPPPMPIQWNGDSISIADFNRKPEEAHVPQVRTFDVVKLTLAETLGVQQTIKSEVIRRFKIVTSYTIQTNVDTIVTDPVLIGGIAPWEVKSLKEQIRNFTLP